MFKKILSVTVLICFFFTALGPCPQAHGSTAFTTGANTVLGLPAPGTMVNLSPAYEPVIIKGLVVHKNNPFLFDFIVDVGQDRILGEPLKKEGEKLIKYFLASLAIPDKDVWVNLSPYEKDRMIPEALGQTDMGRDLLEQDYILKQLTASLIYPEKQLGKIFWDKVYKQAQAMYGTTQIPVNTFNKVWIMADRAEVFEHKQTAFVVDSHLKVMLEEDYLALQKHSGVNFYSSANPEFSTVIPGASAGIPGAPTVIPAKAGIQDTAHSIASQIVRQIILPQLEKEVNTGKNFANLRQIFNSIILSSWYKKNLKQALLNQVYANQSKVRGIDLNDPTIKQQIYDQYLKAYRKGVFNYIKEEPLMSSPNASIGDPGHATIPRKYFSGGINEAMAANPEVTKNPAKLVRTLPVDRAMVDFTTLASTQPIKPNSNAAMAGDQSHTMTLDAAMKAATDDPHIIQEVLEKAYPLLEGEFKNTVHNLLEGKIGFKEAVEKTMMEGLQGPMSVDLYRKTEDTVRVNLAAYYISAQYKTYGIWVLLMAHGARIIKYDDLQMSIAAELLNSKYYQGENVDDIAKRVIEDFDQLRKYDTAMTAEEVVDLRNIRSAITMDQVIERAIPYFLIKIIYADEKIIQALDSVRKAKFDHIPFVTLSFDSAHNPIVQEFATRPNQQPGVAIVDLRNIHNAEILLREAFMNALRQVLLIDAHLRKSRKFFIRAMGKRKVFLRLELQDGAYKFVVSDAAMDTKPNAAMTPIDQKMSITDIPDTEITGKVVALRLDLNLAFDSQGKISDNSRLIASLPTVKYLTDRGAKVVIMSHREDPYAELKVRVEKYQQSGLTPGLAQEKARRAVFGDAEDLLVGELSLLPVHRELVKALDGVKVKVQEFHTYQTTMANAAKNIARLNNGEVLLLENVRFNKEEKAKVVDQNFVDRLFQGADLIVDDAFGAYHRPHASIVGTPQGIRRVYGLLVKKELNALNRKFQFALMGGLKVEDKIKLLQKFLSQENLQHVAIGGAMANAFLAAKGIKVGKSLGADPDQVAIAKSLLSNADFAKKIILPSDVVAAESYNENAFHKVIDLERDETVPDGWMIVDIGPDTTQAYGKFITQYGADDAVFWNGPMGAYDALTFAENGTKGVAEAMGQAAAYTVIGGGESSDAARQYKIADKVSHNSTGGGAALKFLEDATLDGIKALTDKPSAAMVALSKEFGKRIRPGRFILNDRVFKIIVIALTYEQEFYDVFRRFGTSSNESIDAIADGWKNIFTMHLNDDMPGAVYLNKGSSLIIGRVLDFTLNHDYPGAASYIKQVLKSGNIILPQGNLIDFSVEHRTQIWAHEEHHKLFQGLPSTTKKRFRRAFDQMVTYATTILFDDKTHEVINDLVGGRTHKNLKDFLTKDIGYSLRELQEGEFWTLLPSAGTTEDIWHHAPVLARIFFVRLTQVLSTRAPAFHRELLSLRDLSLEQYQQAKEEALMDVRKDSAMITKNPREYIQYLREHPESTKKLVLIVGTGPAGLKAGDLLLRKGYRIAYFEKNQVLSGLGGYGIPEVGNQAILKENVFALGLNVLAAKLNETKVRPPIGSRSDNVRMFFNVKIGQDISLADLEATGAPVFMATGAQRPRLIKVEGENLRQVINATHTFFRRINTQWLNKQPEVEEEIKYTGEPWQYGPRVIVYGGGNVASDAILAAHRQIKLKDRNLTLVYRGPLWAMANMDKKYFEHIAQANKDEKAGIHLLGLMVIERFEDKNGDGKIDHVVFRKQKITGLKLKDGKPQILYSGVTYTPTPLSLPPGKTMRDLLRESGVEISDELNSQLSPGIVYQVETKPTDELEEYPVDLVIKATGDEVEPIEELQLNSRGAFDADPKTGRVRDRKIWVLGQALTQRGAVADSFRNAKAVVEDFLRSEAGGNNHPVPGSPANAAMMGGANKAELLVAATTSSSIPAFWKTSPDQFGSHEEFRRNKVQIAGFILSNLDLPQLKPLQTNAQEFIKEIIQNPSLYSVKLKIMAAGIVLDHPELFDESFQAQAEKIVLAQWESDRILSSRKSREYDENRIQTAITIAKHFVNHPAFSSLSDIRNFLESMIKDPSIGESKFILAGFMLDHPEMFGGYWRGIAAGALADQWQSEIKVSIHNNEYYRRIIAMAGAILKHHADWIRLRNLFDKEAEALLKKIIENNNTSYNLIVQSLAVGTVLDINKPDAAMNAYNFGSKLREKKYTYGELIRIRNSLIELIDMIKRVHPGSREELEKYRGQLRSVENEIVRLKRPKGDLAMRTNEAARSINAAMTSSEMFTQIPTAFANVLDKMESIIEEHENDSPGKDRSFIYSLRNFRAHLIDQSKESLLREIDTLETNFHSLGKALNSSQNPFTKSEVVLLAFILEYFRSAVKAKNFLLAKSMPNEPINFNDVVVNETQNFTGFVYKRENDNIGISVPTVEAASAEFPELKEISSEEMPFFEGLFRDKRILDGISNPESIPLIEKRDDYRRLVWSIAEHFQMTEPRTPFDSAMTINPGGIDLNTSSGMQWKVSKDGRGVKMNVDPAQIARIQREGINWLSPIIFKMTPVTNIWPLLGLQAPSQETHLAKV